MSAQMLIVSFRFNTSPADYALFIKPLVKEIVNIPGLRWKIWLMNEHECKAGGLYLFDDSSYLQSFLKSEIMNNLQSYPAFTDFSIMPFDLLESETKVTHGPLGVGVKV